MKMPMLFLGGPYSGQVQEFPSPDYRSKEGRYVGPCPYLVNVVGTGGRLHCYLTVRAGTYTRWRLRYMDTF